MRAMTSGLEWKEWGVSLASVENDQIGIWFWEEGPMDYILSRDLQAKPGTRFSYSGGDIQILVDKAPQARRSGHRWLLGPWLGRTKNHGFPGAGHGGGVYRGQLQRKSASMGDPGKVHHARPMMRRQDEGLPWHVFSVHQPALSPSRLIAVVLTPRSPASGWFRIRPNWDCRSACPVPQPWHSF